jgi:hypothetical protein
MKPESFQSFHLIVIDVWGKKGSAQVVVKSVEDSRHGTTIDRNSRVP